MNKSGHNDQLFEEISLWVSFLLPIIRLHIESLDVFEDELCFSLFVSLEFYLDYLVPETPVRWRVGVRNGYPGSTRVSWISRDGYLYYSPVPKNSILWPSLVACPWRRELCYAPMGKFRQKDAPSLTVLAPPSCANSSALSLWQTFIWKEHLSIDCFCCIVDSGYCSDLFLSSCMFRGKF